MPRTAASSLTPRKSPVQTRSAVTVDAVLEATIQVLLREGKERLTTTRVAERAGVSVGTLYQYFPNKRVLLQAALQRHMEEVVEAVERVCREQAGGTLAAMATAIIDAFLAAKMRNAKASVALYSVSSDLDGARIARQTGMRVNKAIVALLSSAQPPLDRPPELVAAMLQSAMAGMSRRILESPAPEEHFGVLREELIFLARTYAAACVAEPAIV